MGFFQEIFLHVFPDRLRPELEQTLPLQLMENFVVQAIETQ